jgi:predicted metal-dependent phosphoesterase TrpH
MRFELHCHSTCSDGSEPPERVAARAAERGVAVFALTDHDTCAGTGVAVAGARSIRAVEISCSDDLQRTVHVLAYERPGRGDWAALVARLETLREARRNRVHVMATKLEMRGIKLDVTALLEEAKSRSIGRPDLAKLMVTGGHASSIKDAFSRHLYDQGPVDVPHKALSLADAITLGRDAGAAMSLAHPHLYDDRSAPMLRTFKDRGLDGIEAFHGMYDGRERSRWLALADQLGLVCTGGSDWHGPEEAHTQIGVDLPDDRSNALLQWLA